MNYSKQFIASRFTFCVRVLLLFIVAGGILNGCEQSGSGHSESSPNKTGPEFVVCATGEGKLVSDVVSALGREKGVAARVRLMSGTFDVLKAVRKPDNSPCHAIIVSASSWLDLNMPAGVLRDRVSLMTTQLVVGLTDEAVNRIGLKHLTGGNEKNIISPAQLMNLIRGGKLKLAVPTTTSNAGVSFLLLATSAFAGEPTALTKEQVEDQAIVLQNRDVMSKVLVRGGSSELKDWFLANSNEADGMVNYAGLIAQYNQQVSQGSGEVSGPRVLKLFYLNPTYQADVPMSYVVKKNDSPELAQFYRDLVVRLMTADVQRSFYRGGYHPASLEFASEVAPTDFFKPEWGFDAQVEENLAFFIIPDNSQLLAFVRQSYEAYRKSAYVGLVVDFSGSMLDAMGRGDKTQRYRRAYEALEFLLSDDRMEEIGLPYRDGPAGDKVSVVPFSTDVISMDAPAVADSPAARRQQLRWLRNQEPGGKTALYKAVNASLLKYQMLANSKEKQKDLACTIVLLTDGIANVGDLDSMFAEVNTEVRNQCVVFAIGIGEADERQLRDVVRPFEGQVFLYQGGEGALIALMRKAFGANR